MDPVLYSLGDTISGFFASHAPVTQQQCDDLAVSLVGGPVNLVLIQGSFTNGKHKVFVDGVEPKNEEELGATLIAEGVLRA